MFSRSLRKNFRNALSISTRFYSESAKSPAELATEVERSQVFERALGKEDPFKMRALKRKASTKSNPNLIPSYYDCRIVGCVCEEDSNSIVWMWLFKGEPRKCHCGHWFKLIEYGGLRK